jgi:hypothetical protein
MKILIDNINIFYNENLRLVKTLMKRESPKEHPELMKWALQMLYFKGDDWIEICRIDNYMHENQTGSHIHIYDKEEVKRIKITFQEAEKTIIEISNKILKEKFNEIIHFGDEEDEL